MGSEEILLVTSSFSGEYHHSVNLRPNKITGNKTEKNSWNIPSGLPYNTKYNITLCIVLH